MKMYPGMGLKPEGPNLNVVNVLRSLVEDLGNEVYIPYTYKNSTHKDSSDPRVHFYPSEAGRPMHITSLEANKERFNFNVTGTIDVLVEYQNNSKVEVSTKKVFRSFSIIRDGKITINSVLAKLSPANFKLMRDAGILYYAPNQKVGPDHERNMGFLYQIYLTDIPVISLNWAQPVNMGLYDLMRKEVFLSEKSRLLRKWIKELKDSGHVSKSSFKDSDYYTESNNSSSRYNENDGEEHPCVVYELVTPPVIEWGTIQEDVPTLSSAINELDEAQKELRQVRLISRCIVWAIESSSKKGSYNWSKLEDVPRSKGKKRQYATVWTGSESIEIKRTVYNK